VQGDNEWEESKGAWAMDEAEEEEAMIVGIIRQVESSSWQEVSDSWMELDEGEASGVYCVGTCQGVSSQVPEVGEGHPCGTLHPPEDEEIMEDGWWSHDPRELQVSEEEQEYFIELLMGGSAVGGCKAALERLPAASGTAGHPAGRGGAAEQKAQLQGEVRESKPAADKEKGRSSEGAFKGEDNSGTRTGEREAGARSKEGPKGWRPWWPSGRKQEGSPGPYPDLGTKTKVI
jgi:hypothetical protein